MNPRPYNGYQNNRRFGQNGNNRQNLLCQKYNLPANCTVYELHRTGKAVDVKLEVRDPNTSSKIQINGTLDSGAFATTGSVHLHEKFCKQVNAVTVSIYLVLPDGTPLKPVSVGLMDVTAINRLNEQIEFKDVMVFMVDSPLWKELLIGRPTLRAHNLLPEQNFARSNTYNNRSAQNNAKPQVQNDNNARNQQQQNLFGKPNPYFNFQPNRQN